MGGKKKAHTAFYDKKRAISNGKKRETTDRRGEIHSIEQRENIRQKRGQKILSATIAQ